MFHHTEPLYLQKEKWDLIYNTRNHDNAISLVAMFNKAGDVFGIRIEDP